VLLGAVAVVCAVWASAGLPAGVAEERAFASAAPCKGAGAVPDGADCLHTVRATVTGTVIQSSGRTQTYRLKLSGPAPASGSVDMGSAGPLLKRLKPGDQVSVTVWRSYATAVSMNGVTQGTEESPVGDPEIGTALALGALACGTYLLGAGGYALLRARRAAERGLPASLVPWGKTAVWAALVAWLACLVGVMWGGPVTVVVAWVVMLPVVGWIVAVRERRRAKRGPFTSRRLDVPRSFAP
jgi:protein involved in polysaccharide export with SLBB domain